MPKLKSHRAGNELKIKDAVVEFSHFPTIKKGHRAGLQSKAYTTDAWSVIHASVRRIRLKKTRLSAIAFAEQSHEFYTAALASSTVRAKPLLLYYSFLNLTKSLCLRQNNSKVVGRARHGLEESVKPGTTLKAAKITGFPTSGPTVNMFDEFLEAVGEARLTVKTTYRVHDLISCSLIGHRLWCDATRRADRFLRLHPIQIMHDSSQKAIWLRAGMQSGSRIKANIACKDIARSGFGGEWQQVTAPQDYSGSMICWEQKVPTAYTGRAADKVEELARHARAIFYRSLTVAEPYRNYYVVVPPKRFKKHHQMAARYALLYFLGSVTRYHPSDFESYMSSEFGPFLGEFLASEPSQMLFEMACLFAGREVVSVGLA